MEQILNNIKCKIIDVALTEEKILKSLGKGIFYMPELAFSYTVGKEIALNGERIFKNKKFEWIRESTVSEQDLKPVGIFDLIFKLVEEDNKNKIVIEFKMPDKDYNYEKDIEKLHSLPKNNYSKVFCALEDIFDKNKSEGTRMDRINKNRNYDMKRIGGDEAFSFQTYYDKFHYCDYKQKILCFIEIWQVF